MKTVRSEMVSDEKKDGYYDVFARIYSGNYENTLGTCQVFVHEKGIAEIYGIVIDDESDRRKHYGTKLWKFVENYVIKKYNPACFTGSLESSDDIPAVEFWKKQNFQLMPNEQIRKEIN